MDYKRIAEQTGPRVGATQEWIFQVLRNGIINGNLPGGTQLKQDEISSALNVSHIPVREALRRLEAQGLVKIHPNRGASVTSLTQQSILDMMQVRATLAVMMLKNSAPHLTEKDYDELDEIIILQENETDLYKTEELNYRFHDVLNRHYENDVAELFMDLIHANIDRYLRMNFYSHAEDRERSLQEHKGILEACRSGDYEAACSLLRDHILDAKDYIPEELPTA